MNRTASCSYLIFGLALCMSVMSCAAEQNENPADTTADSDMSDAADSTDPSDGSDASDAADSSEPGTDSDASDVADPTDSSDGSDASDTEDPSETSTDSDASDAADASDSSDDSDESDESDSPGPEACGGFAGVACPAGQICDMSAHLVCGADFMGVCVIPEDRACTAQYDPVCGCNGVTYGNDCEREGAYVAYNHDGPCEVPTVDPYAGRPIGQCADHEDCQENQPNLTCNRAAPGGICTGCGVDGDCPGDTICYVGACVTECSASNGANDCPPGLYCLSSGKCGISWCSEGVCAVPMFGCSDSGRCERFECTTAVTCPENTTCVSDLCIEDRAL